MKIAVIQNRVYEHIEDTLADIDRLLKANLVHDIDFLVLPEMFTTPYELKYFVSHQQDQSGIVFDYLKRLAIHNHVYVIGGSFPYAENGKIYNTSFVFDRAGHVIARYDKIHLFEVEYPDGSMFSEREVLEAGNKIVTFDTEFGRMGLMTCFDIRFPYLAERLMEENAQVIFVPAAFNDYTGPLHWHATFRARAIDNQLFMVGASPSADSFGNYRVYGHSLIVDPFGKIRAELEEKRGILVFDVDLTIIEKVRRSIPIIKNRVDLKS